MLVEWVEAVKGKVCFRGVVNEGIERSYYWGVKEVPRKG